MTDSESKGVDGITTMADRTWRLNLTNEEESNLDRERFPRILNKAILETVNKRSKECWEEAALTSNARDAGKEKTP